MKRAAEWFLYLHDNSIEDAYRFIPEDTPAVTTVLIDDDDDDDSPELYGTALTAEEGLWLRSGWGGRS